jgi:phosphopantothenoylcysteine decarboxylase/phosphopantothenate--cysteine ligase
MGKPQHILITAGPTHEAIDDVRYLANRSSGRMGIALAEAAREAGCEVTLLLGPVPIEPSWQDCGSTDALCHSLSAFRVERFESTADLQRLLDSHFLACDVLIMAAAVADYRPVVRTSGKLPRHGGQRTLDLEPTPDLVAGCVARRRGGQRIIAFALGEPEQLACRAIEKMRSKGVDAIVANPLVTMGSDSITAVVYTPTGETFTPNPPTGDKQAFAVWLVRWLLERAE